MSSFTHSPRLDGPRFRLSSARFVGALALCGSLLAGCATERRYLAKELPDELRGTPWRAPCSIDLSQSAAGGLCPEFDAGDRVEVVLATGPHGDHIVRVETTIAKDGTVEIPDVGRVAVAGNTADAARQAIVQACHQEGSAQPLVTISMQQPRQHHITVTGAVQHPGLYTVSRENSDLVTILAAAGGLCGNAGERIIIQSRKVAGDSVKSPGEFQAAGTTAGKTEPISLMESAVPSSDRREILASEPPERLGHQELKDGDVVFVECGGPAGVIVTGMVQKPGRYELPVGTEFRVLDAVASAQGVSHKVIDTVVVCRACQAQSERALIQVSLREATRNQSENIVLLPGDIVSVEPNTGMLLQDVGKYVGLTTVASLGVFIHF